MQLLELRQQLDVVYAQYRDNPSAEGLIEFITLSTEYQKTNDKVRGAREAFKRGDRLGYGAELGYGTYVTDGAVRDSHGDHNSHFPEGEE